MPTLQELSVLYAKKQPKQVDQLTEDSPILKVVPFEKSSHGLFNQYDEIVDVTGAGFVQLDQPLPVVKSESKLKKVDLSIMGGIAEVGEDKATQYGGANKYFATKLPSILRKSGSDAERAILYNNFLQYAKDNHKASAPMLFDAGGTANSNYLIIAVRFVEGETTGLYDPSNFVAGSLLKVEAISGGAKYKDSTGRLVYGMSLKGYFGLQIASKKTVSAIVNITKDTLPTAGMIDDLISNVHGNSSNTFLFMHDKALTLLNAYKGSQITYNNGDKEIDRRFGKWNGVPIVTSYNFNQGTENKINVA